MKSMFIITMFCFTLFSQSQNLTGYQLLENAINYHDPSDNWKSFKSHFTVVMSTPKASKRTSVISIDLPADYFSVEATRDSVTTTYTIDKGICKMTYNREVLDSVQATQKKMSCDRATLYKNYYTYLYGLPMKLNDPGSHLSNTVERKAFKGKDYLVLNVTYDEAVGTDVWYFYFNPKTYALEVYQFFKTDEKGKVNTESGEYILLSGETTINRIKIPKVRAWYYNKDDTYLGTDTLQYEPK